MKHFTLVLCLMLSLRVCAQEISHELFTIPGSFDFIAMDNLLNVYTIKGTEMVKYDKNGDRQFRYSDKQLGDIGAVDITFPLRPLLTYPGINYVVMLDNTLSNNRGNINLMNHNIDLGTLACTSVQNHFWFYDAMNFNLIRSNENFRPVVTTGNLAQILRIAALEPNYMKEFANRLYINNPSTGILVFDIFGTYIRTIPIVGLSQFQVNDTELIYFHESELCRYHLQNHSDIRIALPATARSAKLQKNRIAVELSDKVVVYQLK